MKTIPAKKIHHPQVRKKRESKKTPNLISSKLLFCKDFLAKLSSRPLFSRLPDSITTADVQLLQLHLAQKILAHASHEDAQRRKATQMRSLRKRIQDISLVTGTRGVFFQSHSLVYFFLSRCCQSVSLPSVTFCHLSPCLLSFCLPFVVLPAFCLSPSFLSPSLLSISQPSVHLLAFCVPAFSLSPCLLSKSLCR